MKNTPLSEKKCFCKGEEVFTPICKECLNKVETLSEKEKYGVSREEDSEHPWGKRVIWSEDLKQAIKELKDYVSNSEGKDMRRWKVIREIDKIFGEELT
jgi:hypothetical protein